MAIVRRRNTRNLPTTTVTPLTSNLFDGNILDNFDRLFNDMASPLMGQSQTLNAYPADMYETGEHIVVEMAVPGLKAEDLEISIEGRQLSIQGKYPETNEDDERRYWLQGIPKGEFSRSVNLPSNVSVDNIDAKIHDGLLILSMPKVEEAKARKIAINYS